MKRFEPNAVCEHCGSRDVATYRHRPHGVDCRNICAYPEKGLPHVIRFCAICLAKWVEVVIDEIK